MIKNYLTPRQKHITLGIILQFSIISFAQTGSIADTINTPYWQEMMKDNRINFFKTKRAYDLYFSNKEKVKGTGFKIFERWAENAQYRINPDGSFLPADHLIKEIKRYKSSKLSTRGQSGDWINLGPFENPTPASQRRMLGRINEIAFHPTNANVLFAGAAAGGLWISSNKGSSWTTKTDNFTSLGVSAIVAIPNTSGPTLLIGSGDRDANDAPGLGVYKSTDGGTTLTPSNTGMGLKVVNRLLLNPQNPNTIVAATNGGIFISYNQGTTWTSNSSSLDFHDLEYCPNDTMTLYACAGGGFYRSTNAGIGWSSVSTGFSSTGRNRLAIAVTAANPNIVYVIGSKSSNNGFESFYKSSNKGASFVSKFTGTTTNLLGWRTDGLDANRTPQAGQGFYDLAIEGNASDSNMVHTGGIQIWRTTNGGSSFSCVSDWTGVSRPFVHADIHCLVRNPQNNELFIGSDGGVDYTTNNGSSYININSGLAISQFYNLGVSQLSTTRSITGAQDNGTAITSAAANWSAALAGDGMECEISSLDTSLLIGSSYYGNIQRSTNNGNSWNPITNTISETGPWVTPLQLHPRVKNMFITAFQNVWLSKNIDAGGTPSFSKLTNGIGVNASAIRFSNANDSLVFVGWEDGSIRYCNNIFATSPTFTSLGSSTSGSGKINDIETSYLNQNILYITRDTKVYKSVNKGVNWTDYSTGLPNLTMHCIAADRNRPEALYVGSASGVYFRDSSMNSWVSFNTGLSANPAIRDIEIVSDNLKPENSKVFAATYGRGLWVSSVRKDSVTIAQKLILTPTLNNANPICSGDSVMIALSGADSFSIDPFDNSVRIDKKNFILYPTVSTSYKAYGRNADGKVGDTSFNVTVKSKPILTLTPKTKTIKKGDTLLIKVTGASTYEWTPDDVIKTANTNSSSIVIQPELTTIFNIKGTSSQGCVGYNKATITVSGVTSISAMNDEQIIIYPNPISDILHIKSKLDLIIKITDISGKTVENFIKQQLDELNIDMTSYSKGNYFLHIQDQNGKNHTTKVSILR